MKPILFNTEMVRAILDGRKTVTRRVVKPHNPRKAKLGGYYQGNGLWIDSSTDNGDRCGHIKDYSIHSCWISYEYYIKRYAPYRPGDILYVRETWYYEEHMHDLTAGDPDLPSGRYSFRYEYKADDPDYPVDVGVGQQGWRPSIHMPKEAARLFLRVTDVRVERLQDITYEQIRQEGVELDDPFVLNGVEARYAFSQLWDSTIKKKDRDRYGWNANPWVWVYEFERISREEAEANA